MKLKLTIVSLFCFLTYGFAQNSGNIKGNVSDSKTGEPLPYVNIIVK